jgi:hypothetical protein
MESYSCPGFGVWRPDIEKMKSYPRPSQVELTVYMDLNLNVLANEMQTAKNI